MKRIASDIRDGLRFQAGRTTLSLLAVCVGMTALTILLSVLGGLRERSRALIADMGVNVFVILPGERTEVLDGDLTLGKKDMLQASLANTAVAAVRQHDLRIANFAGPVKVFAADENYFSIHNWTLKSGRLIDAWDQRSSARSVLVPATLAHDANWHLGQTLFIGNQPFTIVGIAERPGAAIESENSYTSFMPDDSTLFVPLSSSSLWIPKDRIDAGSVDIIEVKVHDSSRLRRTVETARRLLTGRNEVDTFAWITPDAVLANVRRLERIIGLTAGSVAFLCLILGGTTMMSLMVANVRDRIPEIALRRTLGATSRDIAVLFVMEACLITIFASTLGIILACGLLLFAHGQLLLPVALNPLVLLLPILTAVFLGMAFSYLPVRMASAISPAEALRND